MKKSTTRQDRLRKVRALFAKANDAHATEAERDTFNSRVAELMATWDLTDAEVALTTSGASRQTAVTSRRFIVDMGNANMGGSTMINILLKQWGGCCLYATSRGAERKNEWGDVVRPRIHVITAYGTEDTLDRVELWWDHLSVQLMAAIVADRPSSRRSYSEAWAIQVGHRIRSVYAATIKHEDATGGAAGECVALAVRDDSAAAKAAMEAAHPRARKGERYDGYNAHSVAAGCAAGSKASLLTASVGGGQSKALA